jgi:hypothetical protein
MNPRQEKTMQLHQARPPYVEFKQVAVEDRQATIEAGHRVTKDVSMAFIMQPGSKDQVEKVAEEWLAQIKRKMLSGAPDAYPPEWVDAFQKKFDMWKQGIEAPLNGTSLRQVTFLSPATVENYIAMRVLTVEDLAALDEVAIQHAGMGARADRDKARAWLTSAEDQGKAAEQIAALSATVETMKTQMEALQEQNRNLVAQLADSGAAKTRARAAAAA